ncbi:ribosome small subunit-dependent GTPase A [Mameliella sp. AT18]|uniref:ribosome small subunit-dependent GTPase A n=1 Tax=Mameliella sp. AT18 TaxID=3028385 RepID=UPI000841216F|nr:ribosome small subunit-dependent GTPase A [Mameliella sp. AT18]MDD9728542.1 ribosome small subunit-dependent GTPase A [Mameliella sp. AT18]ODM49627.1 ribosome small subunit-dependent GTPase A [Ruegeria sp. PBVC088]
MTEFDLTGLGWSAHFARQLGDDDRGLAPARLSEVHRDRLRALTPGGALSLLPVESTGAYAVGDWVLSDGSRAVRRLDPTSDLTRRAAGREAKLQRIAANVDTLGIVTSCNADFNIARLERYLALAHSAGCLPLVVLTKADMARDADDYLRRAQRLSPLVTAIALDATDPAEVARLAPWCKDGQTLALVGSSGVGKTTLRNTLTGEHELTQGIREDDAKGRHTTTARSLVPTQAGGWLIDTPGMRELQLADADEGIGAVFEDIEDLARQCRFRDCAHAGEPGCAVQAAIETGALDPDRLARWDKLRREDRYNSETVAEARARGKAFGKMVREISTSKKRRHDPGAP